MQVAGVPGGQGCLKAVGIAGKKGQPSSHTRLQVCGATLLVGSQHRPTLLFCHASLLLTVLAVDVALPICRHLPEVTRAA